MDIGRLILDYQQLQTNEFWKFFMQTISAKRGKILERMTTTPDANEMLRQAGEARILQVIPRWPEDIIKELAKKQAETQPTGPQKGV